MNRSALAEVLTKSEVEETGTISERLAPVGVHNAYKDIGGLVLRRVSESLDRELANGNMPA